jgi:hypothetical protein
LDWKSISLANALYFEKFNGLLEDMRSIDMVLHPDPMIIIVGRPLGAKEVVGISKIISCTKMLLQFKQYHCAMEQRMNVVHHTWFGCWWCHQLNPNCL